MVSVRYLDSQILQLGTYVINQANLADHKPSKITEAKKDFEKKA